MKTDPLTRHIEALTQGIETRLDAYVSALAPPGEPIPMRRVLPRGKALAWWRENYYKSAGQQVLQYYTPTQILELDNELAAEAMDEQIGGLDDLMEVGDAIG